MSSSRQNQRQGFSAKFWSALVLNGCVNFLAKFAVGFAGSRNQRIFFSQSFRSVEFVKLCWLVVEPVERFVGVIVSWQSWVLQNQRFGLSVLGL